MLFLCILHVKSTISCFILEVTNYEPLVYHIGLLNTIGFANVSVNTHSIHIYDNYVYLSGLPIFISMHLFPMYLHTYMYAFSQVSCVIILSSLILLF